MKKFIAAVLFTYVCSASAFANSSEASPKDSGDVAALKQLEQEVGDAMVAGDSDKLSQDYADDWSAIASPGKVVNKESMLRDFKSGKDKLEAFELGPMDVQVFRNVAVVQGSVTEKRSRNGKETGGQFVWTDVCEKRAGKWVVVQSAGARVK